jgi:phage gp36-like protein
MYATLADLLARYDRPENPELTQLAPDPDDATAPDATRMEQALTDASGQMDMAFRHHHTLPLEGLSAAELSDLARLCCDIARFRLWSDKASDEVKYRYEDALKFLKAASEGHIRLGVSEPVIGRMRASVSGPARALTRDTLVGLF